MACNVCTTPTCRRVTAYYYKHVYVFPVWYCGKTVLACLFSPRAPVIATCDTTRSSLRRVTKWTGKYHTAGTKNTKDRSLARTWLLPRILFDFNHDFNLVEIPSSSLRPDSNIYNNNFFVPVSGGGQNLERTNIDRPIFRNSEISKDELVIFFIFEIIFFIFIYVYIIRTFKIYENLRDSNFLEFLFYSHC